MERARRVFAEEQLAQTRAELAAAQAELAATQAELAATQAQLGECQACVTATNAALGVSGNQGGACPADTLVPIYVPPGVERNQNGLARSPRAGRAVLVAPSGGR